MAAVHTSTRAGGALLSCVRRVHMASGVALCPHGAHLALARQRAHDLHTCRVVETPVPHMQSGRASVLPSPLTYATEQLLKAPTLPHQQHSSLHTQAEDAETLRAIEDAIGPLSTAPLLAPPQPVVVVISGPSGVGKDAVIQRLKEKMNSLYFVVTATSRPKRNGEVEGRDYFFVSKEKFEGWIEAGMLLEHAVVYGEYKGIPRQQVDEALAAGTDVVLRIDVQGAATVRRLIPHAVSIFIAAETEDELVRRLVARKTEALDKLKTRVQTARQELAHVQNFDYVVVNPDGQMEQCVDQIASIIAAEKLAVRRRQQHAQQQQKQQQQVAH